MNQEENQEPLSLIYDWETTSNKPNSAVASFAAILFRKSEIKTFEQLLAGAVRYKFKLTEQFNDFGRIYDKSTIEWWQHEDQAEAYKRVIVPSAEDISLSEFPDLFNKWLMDNGYQPNIGETIYTRGNEFDPPILSNIYDQFGKEVPYPWWNVRDVRTEIDAITPYWDPSHEGYGYIKNFPYPEGFIKHMETHDCARDILMMQAAHVGLINLMEELCETKSE